MCGIVGVVGAGSHAEGERVVALMNATIVHRGPDDEGTHVADDVALGVRRLSIIDLPGGHQPMTTAEGVTIVFNGEIYNYRALREELAADGVTFATHSDTEVVLRLYARDGIGAIRRLEGMFGLALHDARRRTLHLVRDRLGVKPLYVGRDGDRLLFASELKALLAGSRTKPSVDRQAVHDYLTLRFVPSSTSIWQGFSKLAPGHRMTVDLATGKQQVVRWWSADVLAGGDDDVDQPARFRELFLGAVEKRLLASDVPVGVLLSGGLDSSTISAAAVELGHRNFHTFSVAFDDAQAVDERPYARAVAEHVGSRHHEVTIDRDEFVELLPTLAEAADEPLADLAAIPLHVVSRLARQEVKVVLSGEGADEVLAGYDLELLAARLTRIERLAAVPAPILRLAARIAPAGRGGSLDALARGGRRGYLRASGFHMTHVFDEAAKRALWRDHADFLPTRRLVDGWYDACSSAAPFDQVQQVYRGDWLVEDLLMKADKMSMATSLELRTPFLDHTLVEWAARLPTKWKVGDAGVGWTSKRILREFAVARLPAEIVERPKQGFPVPAHDWLRGELGGWARQRLASRDGAFAEYFDVGALTATIDAARRGDVAAAHRVWTALVLQCWMDRWL